MSLVPVGNATESTWHDLAAQVGAPPFLYPGWVMAWFGAFGRGRLGLFVHRLGGAPAAALPVIVSRLAHRSPTNWHTPEFGVIAQNETAAADLLRDMLAGAPSQVDLGFLSADAARAVIESATAAGRRSVSWIQQESPFISIAGDWQAYLSTRDHRWLRKLHRRRERLEAGGHVAVEVHDGRKDLAELLEQGFAVEASGWKGAGGTSVLSARATRTFYWDVAQWAAQQGWLRLAYLRVDERVAAFNFGLESGGRYYSIKSGMDDAFAKLGPGMLLRYELVKRSFDNGLESYEMLGGDEPWKRDWTSQRRQRHRAMAFDRSPAGLAGWVWNAHGRPAAKTVVGAVRRLRGALRRRGK